MDWATHPPHRVRLVARRQVPGKGPKALILAALQRRASLKARGAVVLCLPPAGTCW